MINNISELGTIYGFLIGSSIKYNQTQQTLQTTLLTNMILTLLNDITENESHSPEIILQSLTDFYLSLDTLSEDTQNEQENYWQLSQIVKMFQNGTPAYKCGEINEEPNNLPLLLVLPTIICTYNNEPKSFTNQIEEFCNAFTANTITKLYTTIYSLLIKNLLNQKQINVFNQIKTLLPNRINDINTIQNNKLITIQDITTEPDKLFWSAWKSGFEPYSTNFVKALQNCNDVVELDYQIKALTGSLVGANVGYNEIPSHYVSYFDKYDHSTIQKFVKKKP